MGDAAKKLTIVTEQAPTMLVHLTASDLEDLIAKAVDKAVRANESKLLTHEEAAERLGITANALHKRIQRGLIEPDQRGGRDGSRCNRFAQSTLSAYMNKHHRR